MPPTPPSHDSSTGIGTASQASAKAGFPTFLAQLLLFLASLAAVFLAGGPREAGMGIFLLTAGLLCVLISPAIKISWSLWGAGISLIGAVAVALAPTNLVGFPEWSANLRNLPGLVLPYCVAADPLLAGFWGLILFLSIFIALYSLASPMGSRQMADLALVAVLGCAVYAMLGWCVWQGGWAYPFYEKPTFAQASFGFFPNRNHTAGFLLTGVILSLGLVHHEMTRGKLFRTILAAGCFALLVSALLLFSVSRAGLLFLFLGILIWVFGLGRYRSKSLVTGGIAIFALIMLFFFFSGSGLLGRLKGGASIESTPMAAVRSEVRDPRLGIARDTVTIIADHPLTGIGLGSYSMVYPFYADKSLRDRSTALHAESDWLTLCSEGGIPSVLIVLAALGLLLREIPKLKSTGKNWPLRWAFLSAFFAELLHGLVDVPLHKPELGWWVLLLGGIGFGNTTPLGVTHGISFRIQRILFILGGLVMICSGSLLLVAQSGRGPVIPPFATLEIQKRVLKTFGDGSDPAGVKGAVEELGKAIVLHPMNQQLYYQLAVLIMAMEDRVERAKTLFSVQQALSPIDPDLLFDQGKTLMRLDPDGTAVCWNEALRRQLALDHSPNSPIARTAELYGSMLREAQGQRDLFYKLQDLSSFDPELRIMWLSNPAAEKDSVGKAINDRAFVESLSMKQKGRLFELWWRSGDRAAVTSYLDAHPEDAKAAIATRAAALESQGKGEQACRMLTDKFGIKVPAAVVGVTSRGQDENAPEDPLAAVKYYMDLGNDLTAKRHLTEVLKLVDRDQRDEGLLLSAQIEMRAGNWSGAFRTLLDYLHATGRL